MLRQFLLLALLVTSQSRAQEAGPEALVAEALAANPTVQARQAQHAAMRARAEVAGAWMDPMLMVEYSNAPVTSLNISDHPMGGLQLKVQQTFRPPAWSRLQREVGSSQADAAGAAVGESELQLAAMVRKTWWMLARSRMLRKVTEEHLARTEELLAAARVRYETGAVGQHAVLRLTVLRDKLTDELGEFDRAEAELTASLGRALGRDELPEVATPDAVDPLAPPEDADWVALALENRPLLAGLDAQQHAADRAARLARSEAAVDPTVWAGYRIRTVQTDMDPGTDLVSVGLGVPIPTGSGRRAGGQRSAALEEAQAAGANHDAAVDGISAEMAAIRARWHRAWAKANTFDDTLIPGARATLETTQSDFSVGRADFASLFEAEVALLDLERGRIGAAVETHLQQAEATAVLGTTPTGGDSE